jgi:uncharacterized membrane protein YkoI
MHPTHTSSTDISPAQANSPRSEAPNERLARIEEGLVKVQIRLDDFLEHFPGPSNGFVFPPEGPTAITAGPGNSLANKILLAHTPQAVQAAIRDRILDAAADVSDISIDIDDGRVVYEIDGRGPSGERLQIEVAADGSIIDEQVEMVATDLPVAVVAALNEAIGDMPLGDVVRRTRDGVTSYEVEAASTDEEVDLEIDANGRILKIESELRNQEP